MKTSIEFLGKTIHLYGVLCTLGIIASIVVLCIFAKKQKFEFFDLSLVILITLLSALIGSKLTFLLVSMETVIEIFKSYPFFDALISVLQGGFVFYGGLIGGAVGLLIMTKVRKENFFKYSNLFALVLPLGHAFGRIGCFISGCCYGMEYDGWLSYAYSTSLDGATPIGVPLLPIQLIEAVSLFILFIALLIIYIKCQKKRNLVTWLYAVCYAVIRFILEFFRGDAERGLFLGLSTSQWISILIIAFVLTYALITFIKNKKVKTEKSE